MSYWKSVLKADAVDWLLEPENPSVRYFALTDLIGKPQTDAEAVVAKKEIMREGVVTKILSKQISDGSWEAPDQFYTAKYKGTVWQLMILAELGADAKDERMQEAIDLVVSKQNPKGQWVLANTFNGRFQTNIEQKGKPSKWITLNALTVLKRFYS